MKKYLILIALFFTSVYQTAFAFEFSSYGSITYKSSDDHDGNNFSISQVELVAQRDLSDKTYAILDILFELNQHETATEIERLSINTALTDTLEIGVGRFMQPLGFWNFNFSHGTLSQDTVSRPYLVDIEHHEKAFLPSHLIGLLIRGESNNWSYSFGIGNTDAIDSSAVVAMSGSSSVTPLNSNPPNDELTMIFRGTYKFADALELGLMFGSHSFSEISDTGLVSEGEVLFEEQYVAVDFYYNLSSFYIFGEYYQIQIDDNQDMVGGGITPNSDSYDATAYYIQAGYRATPKLRFAVRYESLEYDDNSTLFQVQSIDSRTESTFSINYLHEESNIIRLEVKQEEPDATDSETIYSLQWYFYLL